MMHWDQVPTLFLILSSVGAIALVLAIYLLYLLYRKPTPNKFNVRTVPGDGPDFLQDAIDLVLKERLDQLRRFDADWDDRYKNDELAIAASCYLYAPKYPFAVAAGQKVPAHWPLPQIFWRPHGGRIKQLQKGVAMGVAEIERELRKEWRRKYEK